MINNKYKIYNNVLKIVTQKSQEQFNIIILL